ncbi:DUF547 domain-containing protein [Kallotenue papyrolyticum]|uniref:DUF547 domain-containing protein n=1 Tax=Kallotenue papyrolyticum TaxID=1325125 RepID=UPI000470D803|nr:DUF547 domain-containing protein [Kallotenue papyrolyticum]
MEEHTHHIARQHSAPAPGLQRLAEASVWLSSAALRRRPLRVAPLRQGVGAGRVQHGEWQALLLRFVRDGVVDYVTLRRVRRLLEAYLERLAEHDPERFADADDQLAFYLNAYNAIAVYQIVIHPGARSLREVPGAFTRSFAVGRRNLSLHALHGGVLRAFGDPRVHVAIVPAARGAAPLQAQAFTGASLQAELDAALRRLLADPRRGARYDAARNTLWLSPIFGWFAGDFLYPQAMPGLRGLLAGWRHPQRVVSVLQPYLPPEIIAALAQHPTVRFLAFDWSLNDRPAH